MAGPTTVFDADDCQVLLDMIDKIRRGDEDDVTEEEVAAYAKLREVTIPVEEYLLGAAKREANANELLGEARETIRELRVGLAQFADGGGLHLLALRRISAALGHPFRGDTTKTCLDLADEVKRRLPKATV